MNSEKLNEAIVRELYTRYNLQKLDTVSSLIEKSDGNTGDLIARICKKYGVPADELLSIQNNLWRAKRKRARRKIVLTSAGIGFALLTLFLVKVVYSGSEKQTCVQAGQPIDTSQKGFSEYPQEPNGIDSSKGQSPVQSDTSTSFVEREYIVTQKSYFHYEPDEKTKRKAYLVEGEFFLSKVEKNGFVYVEFTNSEGKTSKGWISMEHLEWEVE